MKDPVKDKLIRFELFDRFGAANFYPTIGSAVDAYLDEHAVDCKPWDHMILIETRNTSAIYEQDC